MVNSCRSGDVIFLRPMSSDTFDTSNNLPCVCAQKKKTQWPSPTWIWLVYFRKDRSLLRISAEQSPLLTDKMYTYRQMLVNSFNSAKTSMCRAHEISCMSDSWLQAPTFQDFRHFSSMLKCYFINSVQLWYPETWQFTKTPAMFTKHLRRQLLMAITICRGAGENHNSIIIKGLTV